MSVNIAARYPVGSAPPSLDYPLGSAVNSTTLDSDDGYPYDLNWLNDVFGLFQGVLRAASISANGVPDTARISQMMQGLTELSAGRAMGVDDSGAANVYVLTERVNQHPMRSRANGLHLKFTPAFTNTGASTVNAFGIGVDDIKLTGGITDPLPGQIQAGIETTLIDRETYYELVTAGPDSAMSSVSIEVAADADITLTAAQNQRGHLIITDSPVTLTGTVDVIINGLPRMFLAQNDTLQDLTFKTLLGTGFLLEPGNYQALRCDGADVFSLSTQSGQLKQTIVDIGFWNMQTSPSVLVPYVVPYNDVRGMSVLIRRNIGQDARPLDFYDTSAQRGEGQFRISSSSNVTLNRTTGGVFDGSAYNGATGSDNRGWIIISHV